MAASPGPGVLGVPEDEALSASAVQALEAHLHRRKRYRIRRKHYEQKFEIVGGVPGTSTTEGNRERERAAEQDEVGDDWFGLKEELSHRTRVRLKLSRGKEKGKGRVHRVEKHLRGREKVVGERNGVPEVVVEGPDGEEEDGGLSDVEEGGTEAGDGIALSELGLGGGSLVDSPAETLDSLDSFPFESDELTPSTSRGGAAEEDSQPSSAPLSRTQTSLPPPSGQNSLALPTLLEHRTLSHNSSYHTAHTEPSDDDDDNDVPSSGPSTPTPPAPTQPLARSDSRSTVLTLDTSRPNPKRRDSRSDFSGNPKKLRDMRPRDLQKALAKRKGRIARIGRGAATMTEAADVTEIERALERAGMATKEEERREWVYLVEHQRGGILVGFSSAALIQGDPPAWTNEHLRPSPYTPHDYPLPSPFYRWDHDSWQLALTPGTTSVDGWTYAFRFRTKKKWKNKPHLFTFARRRLWVRGRAFVPEKGLQEVVDPVGEVDWEAVARDHQFLFDPSGSSGEGKKGDGGVRVAGLRAAVGVLPFSSEQKTDLYRGGAGEEVLDCQDPFLAWSLVEFAGRRALNKRRKAGASEAELARAEAVWRDAVVEVNYRMALRALKQCRLDREKLMLWRWWLGLPAEPDPDLDIERAYIKNDWLDPVAPEAAVAAPNKRASGVDSGSWGEGDKRPRLEDMRDLVEGRIAAILRAFEFQRTVVDFMALVSAAHFPARNAGGQGPEPRAPPISQASVERAAERRVEFWVDEERARSGRW